MLVPAIEEGWLEDEITEALVQRYLEEMVGAGIDTLVMGCTHYPLIAPVLGRFLGKGIRLVDSAENCAIAVREVLAGRGKLAAGAGAFRVLLTDASDGFLPVAEQALGLQVGPVEIVRVA